jgi:transcriptional regulator of acetoin/glycerol metabolism
LERAVVLADGPAVTAGDLALEIREPARRRLRARLPADGLASRTPAIFAGAAPPQSLVTSAPGSSWNVGEAAAAHQEDWNSDFIAYERQRLIDALDEARGNKSVAARLLGMPRSTFFSKMKKHGLA